MSKPEIVPVPAVNAVIFNENKEVLFTKRSQTVREPGKWCLPGGHIEVGESWTDAVVREIKEELGIKLIKFELAGIYSDPTLTVTEDVVPDGYHAQFVVASFIVEKFTGEITPNEEVEDWDWFPASEPPDPILKSHPVRARDGVKFKGNVYVR